LAFEYTPPAPPGPIIPSTGCPPPRSFRWQAVGQLPESRAHEFGFPIGPPEVAFPLASILIKVPVVVFANEKEPVAFTVKKTSVITCVTSLGFARQFVNVTVIDPLFVVIVARAFSVEPFVPLTVAEPAPPGAHVPLAPAVLKLKVPANAMLALSARTAHPKIILTAAALFIF